MIVKNKNKNFIHLLGLRSRFGRFVDSFVRDAIESSTTFNEDGRGSTLLSSIISFMTSRFCKKQEDITSCYERKYSSINLTLLHWDRSKNEVQTNNNNNNNSERSTMAKKKKERKEIDHLSKCSTPVCFLFWPFISERNRSFFPPREQMSFD